MKKINLILASALVMGALAVNGQDSGTSGSQDRNGAATQERSGDGVGKQEESGSQDKTGTQGQSGSQDQTGSQGATGTQGTTGTTGSQNYQKEMIVIQSSDVPTSLRNSLGESQYKGWEGNSKIYRSRNNDQFVIEMRDGNQTKIHRFDKAGKVVQGQDQ